MPLLPRWKTAADVPVQYRLPLLRMCGGGTPASRLPQGGGRGTGSRAARRPELSRRGMAGRKRETQMSEQKHPVTNVTVRLVGTDGNAFALLGKVRQALRRAGYDAGFIERFTKEAMAGNYDELLACIMRYVNVE
ncbi:MAG: hypothetical protein PHE09_06925 [Oscillospiraceae bacterium]|nr:hypothetical protein [Oscillospiraceae bacterium]